MPKLAAGAYLLDVMHKVGPYSQDAMGGVMPQTFLELSAYCSMTGALGEDWEANTVIELSREYVSGYNIGLNVLGIPPYGEGKTGPVVSAGLIESLKSKKRAAK